MYSCDYAQFLTQGKEHFFAAKIWSEFWDQVRPGIVS